MPCWAYQVICDVWESKPDANIHVFHMKIFLVQQAVAKLGWLLNTVETFYLDYPHQWGKQRPRQKWKAVLTGYREKGFWNTRAEHADEEH